ncbi:MAG: sigma-70 family RNA polymerase sigma factor [bacterium]|nr:sigma-70 family RNA polymerase sigma factor [bacterium]
MADKKFKEKVVNGKNGDTMTKEFVMDEGLHDAIKSLSEEEQLAYFTREYRDWRKEQKRKERYYGGSLDQEDPDLEFVHDIPDPDLTPEEYCLELEKQKFIHDAIGKLCPSQKTVIIALIFEGKSQEEAAAELGITRIAVALRYGRAIENLKKELEGKI